MLSLLSALLFFSVAHAGPAEGDLQFEQFAMARDGVHWTWSPASAQVLRARGVEPTLVVREGRQLVWSAPLKGTSGIVPLPRRPGPQATIEVVGFAKDWEVRSI